jgi:hypothetical protein
MAMKTTLLTVLLLIASVAVADQSQPPAKEAERPLISAPSFEEPLDSSFSVAKGSWTPADGILTAAEIPADKHVAVLHHNVGLRSAVIECEFRLDGSPQFLVGCDGKKVHVGRVVIKATGVDIAEDSVKPSHVIATLKMPVAANQWHQLRVEWTQDEMIATLDGQTVRAKHEYFATPKSRSWLAVPKSKAEIRKFTIRGDKTEAE